ncbi:MAG: SDR family NAD(P)-dependent oxidoreductase [Bdellovibrionaceae bacterium]|nr:SDR family NAD(P)-dependent oxidoreductase [Pseudobdellovibrionaceae bacterium]
MSTLTTDPFNSGDCTSRKSRKPLVVITGASTGLGLATLKKVAKDGGFRIIATCRSSSMARFAKEGIFEDDNIRLRELDVTDGRQRLSLIQECESTFGGLDILINNAGIALRSVAEDASADERMEILNVNYISPMRLIALAIPGMRNRRSGKIINISSAAGIVGMMTVDSKAASSKDTNSPYSGHYYHMERLIRWTMQHSRATPETIASSILATMKARNPSLRIPVTFDAYLLYWFRRFFPRALYHWLMFKLLPSSGNWGLPLRRPRS